MKSLEEVKKILAEHKQEILQKYGVKIIGIFGSYARGEQTKESDVDILVDIEDSVGLEFISAMYGYVGKHQKNRSVYQYYKKLITLHNSEPKPPFTHPSCGISVLMSLYF
jgi:predicted nucleotidyltransferase